MGIFRGKVAARDVEDRKAPRRPAHVVLGVEGGGSRFGSTRYKTRRLCPFEDGLITLAKLRPSRGREPLDLGWIIHQGWESYHGAIAAAQATYDAVPTKGSARNEFFWGALREAENAALDTIDTFKSEPGYRSTFEDASRVISTYVDHYRREDMHHILSVEETLEYEEELPEPIVIYNADGSEALRQTHFRYSARLDRVYIDYRPGMLGMYAGECKTAKMINEDLVHGYQQDMQILGQQWLMDAAALVALEFGPVEEGP
jgi:hypothetical protein